MLFARAFPCTRCGLCCQNVHLSDETHFLDRGDGICKYYDVTYKGCSIYYERPDICRVDRMYELHFSHIYSWNEFVAINQQICVHLKAIFAAHTSPI
ncbi:oxidoreductase-like protein [Candidatus Symbiobacter mobilis CR]|uniref:Oxidoreductase-like protein n=1 Tax=Candidatus Symbiobacter mobilis CR TaxID=946483 RepID=U5NB81_9BURK|nr:oxidoreductase-like protein [Candidatus Symbiobacter mobilis CR]